MLIPDRIYEIRCVKSTKVSMGPRFPFEKSDDTGIQTVRKNEVWYGRYCHAEVFWINDLGKYVAIPEDTGKFEFYTACGIRQKERTR